MISLRLKTKITLLVCAVVAIVLLVTYALVSWKVGAITEDRMAEQARDIARIAARAPLVVEALDGKRDESLIQPYAESLLNLTHVEYVVVMDMNGIRKSHPENDRIGQHFVGGDEGAVFMGQEYVSFATGTLGPSLRAFSPVFTPDGRQVGAVSVGILLDSVQHVVDQSRPTIFVAVSLGLLVGVVGAVLLAESIKKTLFGLEPAAIAKLLEERSAMLQSVREGIIAVDTSHQITLINGEAVRLLKRAGICYDPEIKDVDSLLPNTRLKEVLSTGCSELDQEQDVNGITLLTNRVPVIVSGKIVGAIATFRDKTEIKQLAEQLAGIRTYAGALRAQTHEFMNKLHVILGMVRLECYDHLPQYINGIAQQYQVDVGDIARRIKDPVLAGFLLGKLSQAREAGVELVLSADSFLSEAVGPFVARELLTTLGNLVDNALDAVAYSPRKQVEIKLIHDDEMICLEVSDSGCGMSAEQQTLIFTKGYSTKADDRGLGLFLVQRSIKRLNGQLALMSETGKGTVFTLRIPWQGCDANDSRIDR